MKTVDYSKVKFKEIPEENNPKLADVSEEYMLITKKDDQGRLMIHYVSIDPKQIHEVAIVWKIEIAKMICDNFIP